MKNARKAFRQDTSGYMRVCTQRDLEHESVVPGHIDDGEDWQNHFRVGPIAKATISWFTRQYN